MKHCEEHPCRREGLRGDVMARFDTLERQRGRRPLDSAYRSIKHSAQPYTMKFNQSSSQTSTSSESQKRLASALQCECCTCLGRGVDDTATATVQVTTTD
ncbi:hypothetical protein MSG28_007526 [Choristoneura fumiferana]|uniref:Uncharacterized protein n=1 Tax=Choristoneura fumiferana TaxID=7141 RepID=A0ACC0JXT3_CHOFU|nr:hypothetical protein MSG28_007526 [Choristoneura fumiferana]